MYVVNDRHFIQHIIWDRNVFTNYLPCSHVINPNNEACGDLYCITDLCYMAYVRTVFPLIHPSTKIQVCTYVYRLTL